MDFVVDKMSTLLLAGIFVYTFSASFILVFTLILWAGLVFHIKYFVDTFYAVTYLDLFKLCITALVPVMNTLLVYVLLLSFLELLLDIEIRK